MDLDCFLLANRDAIPRAAVLDTGRLTTSGPAVNGDPSTNDGSREDASTAPVPGLDNEEIPVAFDAAGTRREDAILLHSYRRLADLFRDLLSEQTLTSLLERIADTLARLVPYDSVAIYRGDEERQVLVPVLARDQWADEIMNDLVPFGEGFTGEAVARGEPLLVNRAHLDSRGYVVPGTPSDEPEALISVPLLARGAVIGALNLYRLGEDAFFDERDFELAVRFGDIAALALENAHARAELERRTQTDSLTGLYNHRYFYDRLASELARAARTNDVVAVLMVDVDDFKHVNDVFGHRAADEFIIEFSSILQATVRNADIACRIGGDEFGIIMPASTRSDAERLAARLRNSLASLQPASGARSTASFGIAEKRAWSGTPDQLASAVDALVSRAGKAMRTAKHQGKDRAVSL